MTYEDPSPSRDSFLSLQQTQSIGKDGTEGSDNERKHVEGRETAKKSSLAIEAEVSLKFDRPSLDFVALVPSRHQIRRADEAFQWNSTLPGCDDEHDGREEACLEHAEQNTAQH
jgi:hypothetical protein